MGRSRFVVSFFLLAALVLCSVAPALAASFAPLNPAFVDFLAERDGQEVKGASTAVPRGRTPSPVDLSHLAGLSYFEQEGRGRRAFPARFDLRDSGWVSPVRDQAPYGSCWTFSALASLESSALRAGLADPDYSEMHLGYFGYIDEASSLPGFLNVAAGELDLQDLMDIGGDDFRAVALLARGTGAVDEDDAPYGAIPSASAPPSRRLAQVYNFYYDSDSRYQPASVANIKTALTEYGALSAGVYAADPLGGRWEDSPYFNAATSASFIPSGNVDGLSVGRANHAVTIVGWDDGYGRENFNALHRPAADGAWIVKNSWGPGWGDGGYFYLSYEDAVLDTGAAYVGREPRAGERTYQHDPLGWTGTYSPADSDTGWFANVFTATARHKVDAVAFYAGGVGNEYDLYVYGHVTGAPLSGGLIASQSGRLDLPGYHTVALNAPVVIETGQRFSVVVRLRTPGYNFPVAVENRLAGYSDKASASAGESFVSANGASWTDTTAIDPTANVCLKAFATATTEEPTPVPTPDPDPSGGGGCSLGGPLSLILLAPLAWLGFRR